MVLTLWSSCVSQEKKLYSRHTGRFVWHGVVLARSILHKTHPPEMRPPRYSKFWLLQTRFLFITAGYDTAGYDVLSVVE